MERPGHGRVRRAAALALLLACCALPASAEGRGHGPRVFAFIRTGGAELAHLRLVARRIDVLAPNWYGLELPSGAVNARAPDPEIARLARRRGFAIWPVVNAQTDGEPLLGSAAVRGRVVSAVAATAARHRYPGITLDLEGVLAAQRDDYTALVAALAGGCIAPAGAWASTFPVRRSATSPPIRPSAGRRPRAPPPPMTGRRWPAPPTWCSRPATTSIGGRRPGAHHDHGRLSLRARPRRGHLSPEGRPAAGGLRLRLATGGRHGAARLHAGRRGARRARRGPSPPVRRGSHAYRTGFWYQTGGGLRLRAALARKARMRWIGLFSLGREPLSFWRR